MECSINATDLLREIEITIAKILNIKYAAVIEHINSYICNRSNNNLFYNRYWCYTPLEDIAQALSISLSSLKEYISVLKEEGLISIEKFRKSLGDRTNFYTINYGKLEELGVRITRKSRVIRINANSEKHKDESNKISDNQRDDVFELTQKIDEVEKQELKEVQEQIQLLIKQHEIPEGYIRNFIKNKDSQTLKNIIEYCKNKINSGKIGNIPGFIISALKNSYVDQRIITEKRLKLEIEAKQQEFLSKKVEQLQQAEIMEEKQVAEVTLRISENGKYPVSEKTLKRLIDIYFKEGIIVTKEWIEKGTGIAPIINDTNLPFIPLKHYK